MVPFSNYLVLFCVIFITLMNFFLGGRKKKAPFRGYFSMERRNIRMIFVFFVYS